MDTELKYTIVFSIIFVTIIVFSCYMLANKACSEKAKILNMDHEFGFFVGCVVTKEDGSKVLLEQLRELK